MNKLMTTIASALVAMVIAAPVAAQMLPTATVIISGGGSNESAGNVHGIDIMLSRAPSSTTQFRFLVQHVSGYDYFRNHGVEAFLEPGETLGEFGRTIVTGEVRAGQTMLHQGISLSFPNDIIDSGVDNSHFRVILISAPGYRPAGEGARFIIVEDDDCARPDMTTGGVVYQFRNGNMNDSCVCATKSLVEVTPYDRYTPLSGSSSADSRLSLDDIPSYGQSSLKWTNDSTDYCGDSPYQRPG